MYLAVDIGGTKTLLAAFDESGQAVKEIKFPTPEKYDDFLSELENQIKELDVEDFQAACVAVPGRIDRDHGRIISCGNLGWKNESIQAEVEDLIHAPVAIENDAKLAGLSEALLIIKEFKKTLYITISTGIGVGLIINGVIDTSIGDRGGKGVLLEHNGKIMPWEDFASGRAIVSKYGKKANEITSQDDWKAIVKDLSLGIIDLNAILEPDVIVIGGGVGASFGKFGRLLVEEIKQYETPMQSIPPIIGAKRPEEAVIYGCYELVKERYGSPVKTA